MAVLELDKEQIYRLALQIAPQEREEIARKLIAPEPIVLAASPNFSEDETINTTLKPKRVRGKAKEYPFYMADDFDAPLDEMREYME